VSQRARVLWVIALTVLPLVALMAARVWQEYREDRSRIAAERAGLAATAAFTVQVFIENHLATARSITLHPALALGRATPELEAFLERVAAENPDWAGVGVVGPDGTSLLGTRGEKPIYVGDRPYFKQAIATGQPVVSSALIGRRTGLPTIVIAVPFDLERGARGVLLAPLPTGRFAQQFVAKIGSPSLQVAVIDAEGQAFIHSEARHAEALASLAGEPGAKAALGGEAGSIVARAGGGERLVAYAPVPGHGWAVLLSEPAASAFAPARHGMLERLAVLAAILALVAVLGWVLGSRLSKLYQRAVDARAELERALRSREEFLAAASHDLRNPLATVRAAADLLQQSLEHGPVPRDRLEACVMHIDSAARRMAQQIDAFLDVARLQSGARLELDLERLDFAQLVRQGVEECRQAAARHRIALDAPAALFLQGDAPRLQRAVGNLLHNALKYSPDGGDIRVRLARSADGAHAELQIEDSGIGIPPGDLERVFERFQRGSNVVGRIPGTGLGLSGVRQIAEQHGGSIEAKSTVGQGTVFTLRLPAEIDLRQARVAGKVHP